MTSSRLVRGAKTRTIGCICLVLLLGALVYLFQGTQSRLADVQRIANTCSQQAESLSAQLEVLFEYKLRLEKSLQNEKQDRKKAVEDYEKKLKEAKESRDSEKNQLNKKYDFLTQEKNNLQMKMDEAKENYEKQVSDLNAENLDLKTSVKTFKDDLDKVTLERDNLKVSLEKAKAEMEKIKLELDDVKTKSLPENEQLKKLEMDKKELRDKLDKVEKELLDCKRIDDSPVDKKNEASPVAESAAAHNKAEDNKHALEPPFNDEIETVNKGSSSTTPGINPQALYTQDSSAKPSTKQTQNSKAEPLPLPGMAPGIGQIPIPPDDSPAAKNTNLGENQISNQVDTWDDPHHAENNAAIEELVDAPLQGEDDKAPRNRDYPEKDYKDDQGDEDDEEEERMGEFGHQSHLRRDSQLLKFSNMDMPDGGGGVILHPK